MTTSYLIGIDLGTTNSVVYYIDKSVEEARPQILPIPQITELGEMKECDSLPSFLYLPREAEVANGTLALPWDKNLTYSVGTYAQKNSSTQPASTISSAKSWLCAGNVDRTKDILPWNRQDGGTQMSPVEVACHILEHIKAAWEYSVAKGDADKAFDNQQVVLTIPASFDAVARELTVSAARKAGLNITLLEEPQAAFYSWLHENEEDWRDQVEAGETILVCDIGGGTTDFSLIQAIDNDGSLELERVAVGNHILLGGDNMDLALAYTLAQKLKKEQGMQLDQYQLNGLTHGCRQAKEVLLEDESAPAQKLTVLSRGSSLIGGTITVELDHATVEQVLLNGFLPECPLTAIPQQAQKTGLRNFGLEYESDAAITKHLAQFISQNSNAESFPTRILFNGGVTKSTAIKNKIISVLESWSTSAKVTVLMGADPDKSVAKGGCWYGAVKEGEGIRIKAGSSHTYYIGVESSMPAIPGFAPPLEGLCAIPFGLEEGSSVDIPYTALGLIVGEITEFRFFASRLRQDDQPGMIITDIDALEEIEELPPLMAELSASDNVTPGSLVPVVLQGELTEIGTLNVWGIQPETDERWKLEFDLRQLESEA